MKLRQTKSQLSNVFIINFIYIYQTFINLALLQFFLLLPEHEKYMFLAPVVRMQEINKFFCKQMAAIMEGN